MPKQLFLCLFFLFFCLHGFSAVFVVTSNADSGPGTLRDALTQAAANGSTEKDYINFNLPDLSEAGRTINIYTNLPDLSSNLILDASTQPGAKFGISDAKIKIIAQLTDANYNITLDHCLNINSAESIEIYGFLLDYVNSSSVSYYSVIAIKSKSANKVIIGAPTKGNIIKTPGGIMMNYDGEADSTYNRNIKISSNIFGISEYNVSLNDTIGENIYASRVVNLTIGGMTAAEGNKFTTQVSVEENSNASYNIHTGDLLIANNTFGADFTGTKIFTNPRMGSALLINCYYLSTAQFNNNLFVGFTDMGLDVNCNFKFTGNKFGTDITGTQILGTSGFQLVLGYCGGGGIIGGISPGDGNLFAGANHNDNNRDQGVVLNIGSPGVEVVGNSFKCNNTARPYELALAGSNEYFVKIANRGANTISGTATPSSRVDLYYSLSCDHCEPEQQFQSVPADANGKWVYSGTLLNYNIIAASTYQGTTSEFTTLQFTNQPTDVKITMACGATNGSIKGITTNEPLTYTWYDSNGKVVAYTQDLLNAPPGSYYLVASDSYCSITSPIYQIKDAANQINTSNEQITPASCGQANGSIMGILADPSSSFSWKDQNGNIINSYANLSNVPAGNYTLTVTASDGSCPETLPPITIKNTTGPNIDQINQTIQATNCGQSTGSITNITATGTGTLKYVWLNAQQQQVGSSADLINQPAGTYKLQVTDDTQCGPVYSADIIIPEVNGITMDESKVQITNALCGGTGSITGIQVTGASGYKWTDANNHTLITTTPDVGALAPGSYTLTATNSYGCSKSSAVYIITQPVSFPYPVYAATYTQACNLLANGGVSVATDGSVKSARWVDAQGTTVETGSSLSNVVAGTYQLYLTDNNGCEKLYNSYTIDQYPEFTVANYATITADECGLNNGSVGPTTITGGIPPYTYAWSDASNKSLGTSNQLTNVAAGTYILHVNDNGCGSVDITYTVTEQTYIPPAPSVTNVQLCSSGNGLLTVNNPSANTTYRLYASQSATQPLDEQKGGRFNINVPGNVSYYVSEVDGTCESSRAEIDVTVGVSSTDIANAFTPNGDGINDYWQIKNIDNYINATIQVFNRYGQLLFESKGYAKPFDGTYKGQKLAAGVYYYIINLNAKCNLLSGSLTLIR